jgi:hypothetical protein
MNIVQELVRVCALFMLLFPATSFVTITGVRAPTGLFYNSSKIRKLVAQLDRTCLYTGKGPVYPSCEHVVPKSFLPGNAVEDLHNIFLAETYINNVRTNYSFGEFTTFEHWDQCHTIHHLSRQITPSIQFDDLCKKHDSKRLFFPSTRAKGTIARACFYMLSTYTRAIACGDVDMLRRWNMEHPPTAEEIEREKIVYKLQGRRNLWISRFPNNA